MERGLVLGNLFFSEEENIINKFEYKRKVIKLEALGRRERRCFRLYGLN